MSRRGEGCPLTAQPQPAVQDPQDAFTLRSLGAGCRLDPTPLIPPSVTYHLGYRREELIGRSWYSLLHPEDADLAAAQHRAVGEWPCLLPWSGYTQDQNGQDKAHLVLLTVPRRKQRVSDMPVRGCKHNEGLPKGWTSPLLTPPVAHSAGAGAGREPRGAAPAPPGPQLGLAPRLGTPGPRPHRLLQPQPQVSAEGGLRGAQGGSGGGSRSRPPGAAPQRRVRLREEEAAYLRDRPRGTGPAAPHSPALSRLAAQLRALADSLSPPSCAVPAPCPGVPGAPGTPGAYPAACPDAALALARLLGDALEAAPPGTAHARPAPQ